MQDINEYPYFFGIKGSLTAHGMEHTALPMGRRWGLALFSPPSFFPSQPY